MGLHFVMVNYEKEFCSSTNETLVDPRQHTGFAVLLLSMHRSDNGSVLEDLQYHFEMKSDSFKRQYQLWQELSFG